MIAFLADEDFNARIIRGLRRRNPEIDVLTVTQAGLGGWADPAIFEWAASQSRIILTHDVNTLIAAALDRVRSSQVMRGVIAVPRSVGIGSAIADLNLIATLATPDEMKGQVWYLPL